MMPSTPAGGTASHAARISQVDQKPACLLRPTVPYTSSTPAVGHITDHSAYTKPIGRTATIMRAKPMKVNGPVVVRKKPSQYAMNVKMAPVAMA